MQNKIKDLETLMTLKVASGILITRVHLGLLERLKMPINRHWLAHGRYWYPKTGGQNYDYNKIYQIAETVLNSLSLEGINA